MAEPEVKKPDDVLGTEKKEKQKENGVRVNMLLTEADRAATRPHRKLSPVDGCNKRQALCYRL